MKNVNRIVLIGYMGSGKSTIGKLLAKQLNFDFVDMDTLIELRTFKTITEIFQERGEDYFRHLEKETLLELLQEKNIVIATGGGTPCFFDNMKMIKKHATSFFLNVSEKELKQRLQNEMNKRPLLKDNNNLLQEITDQLKIRKPIYSQANYTILSHYTPQKIVEIIIQIIEQNKNQKSMKLTSFFSEMLDYNYEVNHLFIQRMIQNQDKLSEKSIELFSHIFNAHHIWNTRMRRVKSEFEVWQNHSIEKWEELNETNYKETHKILEGFPLEEIVMYTNTQGHQYENKMKDIIFHIMNHTNYHRAQIVTELKKNKIEPLSSDYISFKR